MNAPVSPSGRVWPEDDPCAGGLHAQWYAANVAAAALTIQRCGECREWRQPARYRCARCHSAEWSFEPVGPNGLLVERTITRRALHPSFAEVVPYAIGVIALDAGPRLFSIVRTEDPMGLRPGDALTMAVNGYGVPYASPASAATSAGQ